MKKNLIVCAALLLAFKISYAQTEKGTQTLGLDFGAGRSTSNQFIVNTYDYSTQSVGATTTNFAFGPNYSYFIADKLDVGAALNYQSTAECYTTNSAPNNGSYPTKFDIKSYGVSAFIRKYYMYKNLIGFRTGAYFMYNNGTSKQTYVADYAGYSTSGTTSQYGAHVKLDLVYYPSKRFGISANIAQAGYSWYKTNSGAQGHETGDTASINFINDGLMLSVFYVFGDK